MVDSEDVLVLDRSAARVGDMFAVPGNRPVQMDGDAVRVEDRPGLVVAA